MFEHSSLWLVLCLSKTTSAYAVSTPFHSSKCVKGDIRQFIFSHGGRSTKARRCVSSGR